MTSGRPDKAQIASDATALVLSGTLLAVLLATRPDSWRDSAVRPADPSPPAIEVSFQQAPATTPAAAPTPPPIAPVAPRAPATPAPHKVLPHPLVPRPAPMLNTPLPEPESLPVDAAAVPDGGALIASSAAAMVAAAADSRADLEAQYAAGLRADIDRRTQPPDSAQYRLHRPSGEVRVGFAVLRNGLPKDVRVIRSSGSSILDAAAVTVVSAGHYPPMPENIFSGETQHLFAVTIEFRPPST